MPANPYYGDRQRTAARFGFIPPDTPPRTRQQAGRVTLTREEAALALEWLRFYCDDECVTVDEMPPGSRALYEKLSALGSHSGS